MLESGEESLDSESLRTIYLNPTKADVAHSTFVSNKYLLSIQTSTTRYNVFTFLPKNLLEQFRRLANFYFLLIVLLQLIPGVSPLTPIASIAPLVFVIGVTAIKDAYEDIKRSKADSAVNNQQTSVLRGGKWVKEKWMNVFVGDILRVEEDEQFPCDLVAISSNHSNGDIFIDTAQLDGETGHKQKSAVGALNTLLTLTQLSRLKGIIRTPPPYLSNIELESFDANYVDVHGTTLPLSEHNLLLRGATLRSTQFVHGVAVFTGVETKLVLNAQDAPSKFTHVEKKLNRFVFGLFIVSLLICIGFSVASLFWDGANLGGAWYIDIPSADYKPLFKAFVNVLFQFCTFWILFSNIIPISLYVSMEFVKLGASIFLSWDLEMYDEATGGVVVKTSNLIEELGQVNHIFTDKTGTLTENIMTLRKISCSGEAFTCDVMSFANEDSDLLTMSGDLSIGSLSGERHLMRRDIKKDPRLHSLIMNILLNHAVMIEKKNGKRILSSTSPDEEALVQGVEEFGYKLIKRDGAKLVVEIQQKRVVYSVLATIDFTSTRKRMSIFVETSDGEIIMYAKGADDVIFDRMSSTYDVPAFEETRYHINEYSSIGLRTLCFAERKLTRKEFDDWFAHYNHAQSAVVNRKEKIDAAAKLIECDLELLGATAIEDRLQDFVPQALESFIRAGIKVWVLTGDKQQTAINIGRSCNIISGDMKLLELNADSYNEAKKLLSRQLDFTKTVGKVPLGMVVDGKTLGYCLRIRNNAFLHLALKCKTVICCRVSPIQKAQVVALVKKFAEITLAIGDGANDVSMIQEADVGVGLKGREGSQASRSADFAMGRFHFLRRLLFVHGRYAYIRVATLIQYSFYKNIVASMLLILYQIFCGFSGQTLIDSWVLTNYNLVFTSWPILIFSLFERDLPARYLLRYPELYHRSRQNRDFRIRTFAVWTLGAVWHGASIFFTSYFLWINGGNVGASGRIFGMWSLGVLAIGACVNVVTLKLSLETHYWTWIQFVANFGSILLFYLFVFVYGLLNTLSPNDMTWVFLNLAPAPAYWLQSILLVGIALIPDIFVKWWRQIVSPYDWQILRERHYLDQKYTKQININSDTPPVSITHSPRLDTPPSKYEIYGEDAEKSQEFSEGDAFLAM